jgi:enoyl-CoA hydratase/carnithine racemase
MTTTVELQIRDGIAQVTLNRPDKMNALSRELFKDLLTVGAQLKNDTHIRAVVLHGAGNAFCAGLDMGFFGDPESMNTDLTQRSYDITNDFQQVAWVWHEIPVPVIAAVHGTCFGGGLQIMCGADMRYVHPETRLSILEIKWGLVPDMAGTQLWKTFVREDIIRELTYTGRIFSGEEAQQLGFATRLCNQPLEAALETAAVIAAKSPDAIRAAKRLINQQSELDVPAGMMAESVEQQALMGSPNQIEAIMANMEKRSPRFSDPQS